jgi:flavodoxin I
LRLPLPVGYSAFMNALVVYDSIHGNTEKIARAIGAALGAAARVAHIRESNAAALGKAELLVVASPTQGGRPTEAVSRFLNGIPEGSLKGVVDTRLKAKWVKIFGYAAEKIAARLARCGGTPAAAPEGFFVRAAKGPLLDQELERAAAWARGAITGK